MGRLVECRKYGAQMEGLDFPPFPGDKGVDIFENISKQAWQEWMAHQTTLINEKRLNMADAQHRKYLDEQREKFFSGQQFDHAEGYIPEEDK
jgi:Fe-S cluster biosynthesis and repair protein YggX